MGGSKTRLIHRNASGEVGAARGRRAEAAVPRRGRGRDPAALHQGRQLAQVLGARRAFVHGKLKLNQKYSSILNDVECYR